MSLATRGSCISRILTLVERTSGECRSLKRQTQEIKQFSGVVFSWMHIFGFIETKEEDEVSKAVQNLKFQYISSMILSWHGILIELAST